MYKVGDTVTHHNGAVGQVTEIGGHEIYVSIAHKWPPGSNSIQRWARVWVKEDEQYGTVADPFEELTHKPIVYREANHGWKRRLNRRRR